MNKLSIIVAVALLMLASAERHTREETLTLDTLTHVLSLRKMPKRCRARMVFRTVACLCFISYKKSLITTSLEGSCMALFGRPARGQRPRCGDFVIDGRLRAFKAVSKARRIQEKCFVETDAVGLPPGADAPGSNGGIPLKSILERLDDIKDVLDEALGVLDVMFVLPSTPARVIAVGDHARTLRLVAYNGIDGGRV